MSVSSRETLPYVGPVGKLRLAVQSARCVALFRRRGIRTGLVTCEGQLPVVHGSGTATVGRLALRGSIAPVEIGAIEGGELRIGNRVFVNQGASIVAAVSISIGDDARIGDFVAIYDSDQHPVEQGAPVRTAGVEVERNA